MKNINKQYQLNSNRHQRAGFTLIELMVVVTILLLLAGMTFTVVNVTMDGERISTGARQLQSYLEGARNRAAYAREPRGIRFLPNSLPTVSGNWAASTGYAVDDLIQPPDPNIYLECTAAGTSGTSEPNWSATQGATVSDGTGGLEWTVQVRNCLSMVFIGPPALFPSNRSERIQISSANRLTKSGSTSTLPEGWTNLFNRGLLVDGSRLRIFDSSSDKAGKWYTLLLVTSSGSLTQAYLTRADLNNSEHQITGNPIPLTYELQLQPTVLPNQEPRQFARGIVLDMANSSPNGYQDVLFSPNGTIFGTAAAQGRFHYVIADLVDITLGLKPGRGYFGTTPADTRQGDERIITLTTKTGSVITYPVKQLKSADADVDAFEFAEIGLGGS